jgi:hypothetical protein
MKNRRLLKSITYGFGIIFSCFAIPMLLGDLLPFKTLWYGLMDLLLEPMWLLDHPIGAIYEYLFPNGLNSRPLAESMVAAIIFDAVICSAIIYVILYGRDRLKNGRIVSASREQA